MYRKILVPLDGSENSEKALPAAIELVQRYGAEMHILLAYDLGQALFVGQDDTLPLDYKKLKEHQRLQVEGYLVRKKQELQAQGLTAQATGRAQDPVSAICSYASEKGIDLIVMSARGRSGLMRWVSGSVAEQILRVSPCPVLVLRAPA